MLSVIFFLLAAVESTCVPINSDMFWVTLPGKKGDSFVRTQEDPNVLAGVFPWYGVVRPERGMVNIMTKESFKGVPAQYCFVNGHLRFMSKGGTDSEVDPAAYPKPKGNVRGFWPTPALYAELLKENDIWKGSGRLRLFSRNPNRTALLMAQLAILSFALLCFAKSGVWRLHGALLFLIFLCLQFQTLSRGGLLSFGAGLLVLLHFRLRRRLSRRTVLTAAVMGGVFLAVAFSAWKVRSGGGTAESDESRMVIWREVPRMIAAAPLGWGLWKSGPAYNGWFEKPERRHMIGDLFNDHLSRFVEGGFVLGGLYVLAWCCVFIFGWRGACRGRSPAFLALGVNYFVASSVNPMNYWSTSFLIPSVIGAIWLVRSAMSSERKHIFSLGWPLGCTALILLALGAVAFYAPAQDLPLRVSFLGRRVVAGTGEPRAWVADDGFVLNGNFNGYPGRELRQFYRKHPAAEAVGIVERVEDLPREMDTLVLTGTCGEDYLKLTNPPKAKHIVFYTPPFGSEKIPEPLRRSCDVHLLTGEFAAVRTGDDLKQDPWIHVVPGAQVYVPGWLDVVVKEKRDEG